MTLREDFEGILREYGHHVLVVRAGTETRCSCWNEKTQETSRYCPSCFGLGVVPVVEKHTVRCEDTSVPETLVRIISGEEMGDMAVPGRLYYFKHDAKLQLQDLIIEVDWSPTGKPIYNGGYVMAINHIEKKRWEGGEVVYQKVYAKDEPVAKQIRGIRVANINGIINYELIQEGAK